MYTLYLWILTVHSFCKILLGAYFVPGTLLELDIDQWTKQSLCSADIYILEPISSENVKKWTYDKCSCHKDNKEGEDSLGRNGYIYDLDDPDGFTGIYLFLNSSSGIF